MKKTYLVTVEFSGTKTYEVDAENEQEVVKIFDRYSSLDHYDNAIDDTVREDITEIKEKIEKIL